jgi:diacylglycerol kinase family enzyme
VRSVRLALLGRATPLAILPLGTANNIARSLSVDGSPKELIEHFPDAQRTLFDAGVVKGPWGRTAFLESFGVGLFPRVLEVKENEEHAINRRVAQLEGLERGYALFREVLLETEPVNVKLRIDDEDVSGDFLAVQIMNIPVVGPNLPLAQDVDVSDGLLDVVLVTEAEREELASHLAKRIEGEDSPLNLPVRRGRNLAIAFGSAPVSLDDELWPDKKAGTMRDVRAVEITVQPGALHVLRGGGG